jgi:hypothetical protein
MTIRALINSLCASPDLFCQAVQMMNPQALRWSGGGWSIAAILAHLAMNEVFISQRLYRIADGDEPQLTIFVSDQMIPVGGHPVYSPADMLDRWQAIRSAMCSRLAGLPAEAWSLTAMHPTRGKTTLQTEVEIHLAHDGEHFLQMSDCYLEWEAHHKRTASPQTCTPEHTAEAGCVVESIREAPDWNDISQQTLSRFANLPPGAQRQVFRDLTDSLTGAAQE